MKVIVFSELFYPHGGGAELATWLYAKMLSESGDANLTIVTRQFPGEPQTERINKNLMVYRIPFSTFGGRYDTLANIGRVLSNAIIKRLKESDVVYIPGGWYIVIPLAKAFKKPVVIHLHNYFIACPTSLMYDFASGRVRPSSLKSFIIHEKLEKKRKTSAVITSAFLNEVLGRAYNRLGLLADTFIFVSNRQRELTLQFLPFLKEKSYLIYNPPPEIPLVEKKLENPTFMYLGGDSYVKGFHLFLSASQKLLKRGINARFLFAGRVSIPWLLKRLNKSFLYAFDLLGYLGRDVVQFLHSISYASLFPSIIEEPLPYTVLESTLAGTIPIASKVGGVPEILEGTFAEKMMFEPGDVNGLVDRMEFVSLMSSEELINIGHQLREDILKKFDRESAKRKLLKVFLCQS